MIAYEISHEETMSPVDVIVGVERAMRDKGILTADADAGQVSSDEVVFLESAKGKESRVRVFLRPVYQQDIEVLDLDSANVAGELGAQHLVLVYPEIDYELQKSYEAHLRRVLDLGGYRQVSCYQYIPLISGEKKAIALKKITDVRREEPAAADCAAPAPTHEVPLDAHAEIPSSQGNSYSFHRQAALSTDELSQFMDLGVLAKKLTVSRVSVDL